MKSIPKKDETSNNQNYNVIFTKEFFQKNHYFTSLHELI